MKIDAATITLSDIEQVAHTEGMTVIEMITMLQSGAIKVNDDEATLNALCEIKRQVIGFLPAPRAVV